MERDLKEACKRIDIAEQDVDTYDDAPVFNYFSNIRECYKNTNADPYYHEVVIKVLGKTIKQNFRLPNVREDWKYKKISI